MNLTLLTANEYGTVRRETMGGRDYLVAPFVSLGPRVLNGSKGALYYPPDEIAKRPGVWNNIPLTLGHPTDPTTNNPLSASDPAVRRKFKLGHIHGDRVENGWRKGEAWFDEKLTRNKAPEVYRSLLANRPVELSTGLFTENEEAMGMTDGGQPYDYIARNYRPDHLAVLPHQTGACSINDGCGILVNSNPEGHNQYTGGGGGSTGHPAIDAARATQGSVADKAGAVYEASKHYADMHVAGKADGMAMAHSHFSEAMKGATAEDIEATADKMGVMAKPGTKPEKIRAMLSERVEDRVGGNVHRVTAIHRPEKALSDAHARLKESGYTGNTAMPIESPQSLVGRFVSWLTGNAMPSTGGQAQHGDTGQWLPKGSNLGQKQFQTAAERGFSHLNGSATAPADDVDDDGDPGPDAAGEQGDRAPWDIESDHHPLTVERGDAVTDKVPGPGVFNAGQCPECGGPLDDDGVCEECGWSFEENAAESGTISESGSGAEGSPLTVKLNATDTALPGAGGGIDFQTPGQLGSIGLNSNPEGINQYTAGAGAATGKADGGGRHGDAARIASGKAAAVAAVIPAMKDRGDKADAQDAHAAAAGHHAEAAAAHDKAGALLKEQGYHADAADHTQAAAAHTAAAKFHSAASKGSKAAEFHVGNSNRKGLMALTAQQRRQAVGWLTVNCDCHKGKDKVLLNRDNYSDADIVGLVKNAQQAKKNELVVNTLSTPAVWNAMPAFLQKKLAANDKDGASSADTTGGGEAAVDDSKNEDLEVEPPIGKEKVSAATAGVTPAINARQADAISMAIFGKPVAEVRAVMNMGSAATGQRREQLVAMLTRNHRSDVTRKVAAEQFRRMDVPTLEAMAAGLPPMLQPLVNAGQMGVQPTRQPAAVFGPEIEDYAVQNGGEDDGPDVLPTVNMFTDRADGAAKTQARQRA